MKIQVVKNRSIKEAKLTKSQMGVSQKTELELERGKEKCDTFSSQNLYIVQKLAIA